MDSELLRRYLEFYQDLGVKTIYKPKPAPAPEALPATALALPAEPAAEPELPSLAPAGESLFQILTDIGDCRRCRLHEQRTKVVFGVGNERSPLVFVGEGPGADEDAQGIPFVG